MLILNNLNNKDQSTGDGNSMRAFDRIYMSVPIVKRIAAVSLLVTLLLTYRVWIINLEVPSVTVFPFLQGDIWMGRFCFMMLIATLTFILYRPQGVWASMLIVMSIACSVMLDVNRCHVWLIHFVFLFLLADGLDQQQVKFSVTLMLSVTYLFSGLHKFNPGFEVETLPWLLKPFNCPTRYSLQLIIPAIEMVLGIALILPGMNRLVSGCFILIHLLIVYVLLYYRWNYSVFPWNGMLIVYHVLLMVGPRQAWKFPSSRMLPLLGGIVLIPLLAYIGILHSSFSFPLYTGNNYTGIVVFSESTYERLPLEIQTSVERLHDTKEPFLNLDRYAMQQLGVPLFQDIRCYRSAAKNFIRYTSNEDDLVLLVRNGPDFHFEQDLWAFTRSELKAENSILDK